jgi:hypothetical protein
METLFFRKVKVIGSKIIIELPAGCSAEEMNVIIRPSTEENYSEWRKSIKEDI